MKKLGRNVLTGRTGRTEYSSTITKYTNDKRPQHLIVYAPEVKGAENWRMNKCLKQETTQ